VWEGRITHAICTQSVHMVDRLTDSKASALKSKPNRFEVRDSVVRGLYLEVGAKGAKVWWLQAMRGKRRERIRLGAFPALTTQNARSQAMAAKERIRGLRSASEVRTVDELFERYATRRRHERRSWRDVESVWHCWAKDRIGHVQLSDLTTFHALELRDFVASKSSDARARKVLIYLRPMFSWAASERLIDANPWAGLATGGASIARDRVLTPSEWMLIWNASFNEPHPFGEFVRALMLSAQRLSNVAQMRWDEIADCVWTIPREKFKSTRPEKARAHEVPLSKALVALLGSMPKTCDYVFSARHGKPISPGSRQKRRIAESAGVTNWVFHDIRRTAATRMAENKVSRFIIERSLGHADQGVTAIYDRATYRDEKREALDVLAKGLMGST